MTDQQETDFLSKFLEHFGSAYPDSFVRKFAEKVFAPTQGADARPVAIDKREQFEAHWCRDVPAIYRVAALAEIRAIRDKERYKRDEIQWAWESWQAALATRDAAPSDAPIGYVNSMWAEHRVGTTKIYPEAHPRLATFPVFAASAPREET